MNDLSEMWTICHDCPYFEVCEPPYNCAVTENKYRHRFKDRDHYRVQVGTYKDEAMAKKCVKKLFNDWGINSLIKEEDGYYKVQAGYFDDRENAEKYVGWLWEVPRRIKSFIQIVD